MDEALAARVVRRLALDRVFEEPTPGQVAHTVGSLALRNNFEGIRDWTDFHVAEIGRASVWTVDALANYKYPKSEEPEANGFGVAYGGQTLYEFHKEHPDRGKVFGDAMDSASKGPTMQASHVMKNYDWKSLGKAKVVDVGGSYGHVSIAIAEFAPDLTFVVQDLPETAKKGNELFQKMSLDESVKKRISFQGYDMHEIQPVIGANVYFFRAVFHNWPKKYCAQFLKNLVPALNPGTKVLLNEAYVPPPGVLSAWDDRLIQNMDWCMMTMHNANERSEAEWKEIFALASPGFKLVAAENLQAREGSLFSIVEAVREGEESTS